MLRPFWRYYGAKWRIAPRYPKPRHRTIIEPFAGAAGYSLHYPDHDVILVEKYHVIAEIWRWLIAATHDEVMTIPVVDTIADLPAWVPDGARWLAGMCMRPQSSRPAAELADVLKRRRRSPVEGWTEAMRARVASQVGAIRHWRIIEASYDEADYSMVPNRGATWFVDPPYRGKPGRRYVHTSSRIDYAALATWCKTRRGQTIVCAAARDTWLPFSAFGSVNGVSGLPSREAIWWSDSARSQESLRLEAP